MSETDTPRTEEFSQRLDQWYPSGFDQIHKEWLSWPEFARQLERELRAAEEACIKSAADKTFIRGGDIPNTIEAARIALLQRCETAELALTQAQARCAELGKDAARYRWWRDKFWGTDEDLDEVNRLSCTSAEEWDAAIDAALKEPR